MTTKTQWRLLDLAIAGGTIGAISAYFGVLGAMLAFLLATWVWLDANVRHTDWFKNLK